MWRCAAGCLFRGAYVSFRLAPSDALMYYIISHTDFLVALSTLSATACLLDGHNIQDFSQRQSCFNLLLSPVVFSSPTDLTPPTVTV